MVLSRWEKKIPAPVLSQPCSSNSHNQATSPLLRRKTIRARRHFLGLALPTTHPQTNMTTRTQTNTATHEQTDRVALAEMYPQLVAELESRAVRTRRTARQLRNLVHAAEEHNLSNLGRYVAGRYRATFGREPRTKHMNDFKYAVKAYECPKVVGDWVLDRVAAM